MLKSIKNAVKSITQIKADDLLDPKKKTVTVFVPSYPGPKVLTMESMLLMTESFPLFRPNYQCRLELTAGAYLPLMRNLAMRRMIEDDRSEGILYVDHDAHWPTVIPSRESPRGFNALDRLISRDKDIIGGLFTTRTMPISLMCGTFDPATGGLVWLDDMTKGHPLSKDPFQVDWVGCHFLYISKRAALKVADHVGSHKTLFDCNSRLMIDGRYNVPLDRALEQFRTGEIDLAAVKQQIERLTDQAGFFQEDVSFCRRAKAAGCEIWIDPSFEVQHIGDYAYGRMDWAAQKLAIDEAAELEKQQAEQPQVAAAQ